MPSKSSGKPRLARGLGQLLPERMISTGLLGKETSLDKTNSLQELPLHKVVVGSFQPRLNMDNEALNQLAASIRSQGVVQPIVVRAQGRGKFEIIAGERRWRASHIAGLKSIPALVRTLSDEQAHTWALIENIQREDLNVIEEAKAIQRLLETSGATHQQLADNLGRSRASITNTLRLLRLSEGAIQLLVAGSIDMGHARALLQANTADQYRLALRIVREDLTVRKAERLVASHLAGSSKPRKTDAPDPDTAALTRHLSDHLGCEAHIKPSGKQAGQLVIRYATLAELDGLLARLGYHKQAD